MEDADLEELNDWTCSRDCSCAEVSRMWPLSPATSGLGFGRRASRLRELAAFLA